MIVRDAALDDTATIAAVHVRAWQAAYRGVMPDDYLDGLRVEERESIWERAISADRPRVATLVIEDDRGVIAGFAAIGPARGLEDPRVGELYAINLDPDAWGKGLGRVLLRDATARLAAADFEHAILWVVLENARARRFYEREGWRYSGDEHIRRDDVQGATVTEVRYDRDL